MGRRTGRFFASVQMPPRTFIVGVVTTTLLIVLFISVKQIINEPVDITWLYYLNFALVYSLQVAPILVYGIFALRSTRSHSTHPPRVRFLCLVPAYNEE